MNTETLGKISQTQSQPQKPYQTPKLEIHGAYTLTTGVSLPIGNFIDPFLDQSLIPEEFGL